MSVTRIPLIALAALAVCVLAPGLLWAEEVAKPRADAGTVLPPSWANIAPDVRLAAKRAAEVDADRLLVERIYGLHLNTETCVVDLALGFDEIRGAVDALTRGIVLKEVRYNDDLSVEAVKQVTLRTVVETLKRVVTKDESRFQVKVTEIENITRETRDTDLAVMGNGAVPGSAGLAKIQAKRAAEMDCYRRLAERFAGIRLNSNTTVANFILASDQVRSRVCACLAGVKWTDIAYAPDNSCKVTGQLVLRDTIMTIERSVKQYVKNATVKQEEWDKVKIETKDTILKEVGEGVPRAAGAEEGVAVQQMYSRESIVLERVVTRQIGAPK